MNHPNVGRQETTGGGSTSNALPRGERFLREAQRAEKTGVPRSTWRDLMSRKEAPLPVPLPGGRVAWLESELESWMAERVALRRTPTK
ncbi:MAG: hypothetical protein H6R10_2797 [Rhodocyclaceae bacterium]|nr:hypothetical protein [Rhodocyclaceae bacterium]